MTRAVVTGLGAITPIGLTAHDFWENLVNGVSGASTITRFDTTGMPVTIATEVKGFEAGNYMDSKGARRMSRATRNRASLRYIESRSARAALISSSFTMCPIPG